MRLIKHNPAFLTAEELRREFVVREAEHDTIVGIVRENTGATNQHVLLIAPRGMGKTMLVRRVALTVETDPEISRGWLPIVLPEDKYDVATAGDLWIEVLGAAARLPTVSAGRWREAYERLRTERDERRLREAALARLAELSEEEGRRLLVVVENLNMIFAEQAVEGAGWDLRDTLLNEPSIMVLATATCRFDEIDNAEHAFYNLFRDVRIPPLPIDACARLWHHVTGQDIGPQRVRPMEILTGGNPRLLVILAAFSVGRSFDELMTNLVELIDDHTTYFKANVEALPALERRVFVTLADLWAPAGARAVAARARLEVNKTSAYLQRLVRRGAAEKVACEGRRTLYQVTERLYNIYHLLRQSRTEDERAASVTEFMVRFYGAEETVLCVGSEALTLSREERGPHLAALRHLVTRYGREERRMKSLTSAIPEELRRLPEVAEILPGPDGVVDAEGLAGAEALFRDALALWREGQIDEEIDAYDEVVRRFGERTETALAEQVARALFNKGVALRQAGRNDEAIDAYDEVVRRFGKRTEPALAEPVAWALVYKGFALCDLDRTDDALDALRQALQWEPAAERLGGAVTDLAIGIAARGGGRGVLEILSESPAGRRLEPLVVALRMQVGEKVRAPQEVALVAKDVLLRIEKLRESWIGREAAEGPGE